MRQFMQVLASLLFFASSLMSSFAFAAPAARVSWEPVTPIDSIRPQLDPLTLVIRLSDAEGRALSQAAVHVRLEAPQTQTLVSTDFPVVEGSALFDSRVVVKDGLLPIKIVPPIRGSYRFVVDVDPIGQDASFAPTRSEWQAQVGENPAKKKNLVIFMSILIGLAAGSGLVLGITRPARTRSRGLVLGAMLGTFALGLPSRSDAHGDEEHGPGQTLESQAKSVTTPSRSGLHLVLDLPTEHPRVGNLSALHVALLDAQNQLVPARIELSFTQLEHGIEVFRTEAWTPSGTFDWQGQFYDGSSHQITVRAWPGEQAESLTLTTTIEVEGVAPPPLAVAKSFGSLLALTAAAVALGCWLGLSLRNRRELTA